MSSQQSSAEADVSYATIGSRRRYGAGIHQRNGPTFAHSGLDPSRLGKITRRVANAQSIMHGRVARTEAGAAKCGTLIAPALNNAVVMPF